MCNTYVYINREYFRRKPNNKTPTEQTKTFKINKSLKYKCQIVYVFRAKQMIKIKNIF